MAVVHLIGYLSVRLRKILIKAGLLQRLGGNAIFIHIQKTAGTSMVRMFSRHYADSFIDHGDYLNKSADEVAGTRFVSDHFGYGYARQFMDGRFSFTFLREPRERILSFYKFCRSQPPDREKIYRVARDHKLDRFLELGFEDTLVRECIYNHQAWQLAAGWADPGGARLDKYRPEEMLRDAVMNARRLSMVGIVADIDRDFRFAMQQLKLPNVGKLLWENKSNGRAVSQALTEQTRQRLDRLVELDESLYRTAIDWRSAKP